MRLHIYSDLHLEFAPLEPPDTRADVVILAGDIHVQTRGIGWAAQAFRRPVIYVPGNHEYYGGHFKNTLAKMRDRASETPVHVLDRDEVVIDGVRFLGTTLWTDFSATGNLVLAALEARQRMTDYRRIRAAGYRRLRPSDVVEDHRESVSFLRARLAEPFEGKTVVVTHHAPSTRSIAAHFRDDTGHLNAAYVNRLEELLGPPVSLWVHGHTHTSFDYDLLGTRVVCNPRGYIPYEPNPDFDPGRVVEI
jgi:3',5'-cyclic AMP phosphodiesterase CpdA